MYEKCIFHNVKLIKLTDKRGNPIKYTIDTLNREAYMQYEEKEDKFTHIAPASQLIAKDWNMIDEKIKYTPCKYKNLRIFVTEAEFENNKQPSENQNKFIYKILTNQSITEEAILKITFQDIEEKFYDLYERLHQYSEEYYVDAFVQPHLEKNNYAYCCYLINEQIKKYDDKLFREILTKLDAKQKN